MQDYGLNIWSDENFIINDHGEVCINYGAKPSIVEIVKTIRNKNLKGPILLRFPHLIRKQLDRIYSNFQNAIDEYSYQGKFNAVFPLKVNQFADFVDPLMGEGKKYNYGLEAGSKAEFILALAKAPLGSPIMLNGFKDKELINMGFLGTFMRHNVTITIEGLNELKYIIDIAKNNPNIPKIGIRIRLHATGKGIWAKSGGISSKFGLTSTEIIKALNMIKKANLTQYFTMLHFHIGSQITEIKPLKIALREAGNIYSQLRKMGATSLSDIDIGGGLAIEYSQSNKELLRNYSLREYANDILYTLKYIAENKNEPEPNVFIESGRYVSATHSMIVAPVLELFSNEYTKKALKLKATNPQLIEEINYLYNALDSSNALEFLNDSLDHLENLLTLFDLGYIDLQDRANAEVLVNLIIKKAVGFLKTSQFSSLLSTHRYLQEKYLVNFSLFQSMPDQWGLKQHFPIMPLSHLNEPASRAAALWDITCDSDGEVEFDLNNPLFLHDIDLSKEDYFLGFFLLGAYQEVLGMKHNLFTHPTEATIKFTKKGTYKISQIREAQCVSEILEDLGYDHIEIEKTLHKRISNALANEEQKASALLKLDGYLDGNGYLKTKISRVVQ